MCCLVDVLRMSVYQMKENSFTLKKRIIFSRNFNWYNYVDDWVLLKNTRVQANSLRHNKEQTSRMESLFKNSEKNRFHIFNEDGAIFSLNGKLGLQNTLTASQQMVKTPPTSVPDMTLNNLVVRLYCHCSHVHSLEAPDRVLHIGQIKLKWVITLNWIVWNRSVFTFNCVKQKHILIIIWIIWNFYQNNVIRL